MIDILEDYTEDYDLFLAAFDLFLVAFDVVIVWIGRAATKVMCVDYDEMIETYLVI